MQRGPLRGPYKENILLPFIDHNYWNTMHKNVVEFGLEGFSMYIKEE